MSSDSCEEIGEIDPRCRVRHLSRFEARQHVRIWPPATPLHPHEPNPKQAHVSPACCFGHAVSRMLTQRLLNVDAKGTDHALRSEDSRGATTLQGPQILARPEDTKNDWLSQSLLRPLSIVFISRGLQAPLTNGCMRQPYIHRPHRHKRILPARDSASKQPLYTSRFCVVRSGLAVNCACRSCDSSAQLATRDRRGPDSTPRSARRHSESIDLGSSTAATYRPQMRARALSADVFWASSFTTSNKP